MRRYAIQPATGEHLVLTMACPHQYYYKSAQVDQVNIPASSGDMGILSRHIPTIQQLRPGIIQVMINGSNDKKLFTSGGFAVMNPDSTLDITMVEAQPLDSFDKEALNRNIAESQRMLTSTSSSEDEKIQAEIFLEVYQALNSALIK